MSASVSLYFRNALLQKVFRGVDLLGSNMYVALTRKVGEVGMPGLNLDEPVGGGYGRIAYGYGTGNWTMTNYGEVTNTSDINFSGPTAYWGLIGGFALVDAASAGNVLAVGSLRNPLRADLGFAPLIKAGGIVIGLTDG